MHTRSQTLGIIFTHWDLEVGTGQDKANCMYSCSNYEFPGLVMLWSTVKCSVGWKSKSHSITDMMVLRTCSSRNETEHACHVECCSGPSVHQVPITWRWLMYVILHHESFDKRGQSSAALTLKIVFSLQKEPDTGPQSSTSWTCRYLQICEDVIHLTDVVFICQGFEARIDQRFDVKSLMVCVCVNTGCKLSTTTPLPILSAGSETSEVSLCSVWTASTQAFLFIKLQATCCIDSARSYRYPEVKY